MKHEKYIIFTDLKDFTYKNTLLTDTQVAEILSRFDAIIKTAAQKHEVKVIKNIWDAYFAVAESAQSAYQFSLAILQEAQNYDAQQKIDIKKIGLRVTLTFGNIARNTALELEDYFGEAINLGSRIMDITPTGKIFCTENIQKELETQTQSEYLWNFSFHGLLTEVPLYSLTSISQEEIAALRKTQDTKIQDCEDTVFRASCVAAVLSVQPLPFLENLNLVAVHLYMILRVSYIFEKPLDIRQGSRIFGELIAPLGLSYAAFQGSASMIKILLPGIGGYLFAPVSFSVSYALGKIYIMYFYYQNSGETLTPEIIKELFAKHKKEGKRIASERKQDIVSIGKKYSHEILHLKQEKEFTQVQKDTIRMLRGK